MTLSSWIRKTALTGAMAAGLALWASPASADAIITNGSGVYLGINDEGHLNVPNGTSGVTLSPLNSSMVGLYFATVGDATSPGCFCEGFGVSAGAVSGYANVSTDGGATNLTVVSFTSTASTAVSTTRLTTLPTLTIVQDYHPSVSSALYEVTVSLTNSGAAALTDLRYVRVMDWDVPPTEFAEFVTIGGVSATELERSHDNGFNTANPLGGDAPIIPATADANFVDSGPADHGAYFRFNFGTIGAGETKSFKIYYGAAGTEAGAMAALATVGAEVFSLGQCSAGGACGGPTLGTPATFIFGFAGVGGTPVSTVPEPTSLVLLGTGGLLLFLRRRQLAKRS